MNYKEFCDYVEKNILEFVPTECGNRNVEVNEVVKNNGKVKKGISLLPEKATMAPVIYLDDAFDRYKSGGDIKAIMEDIVGVILNAEKAKNFPDLFDFEAVKDMIGFELVNFSRNKERLKDNVWEPVEDLAKVYRVFFIDDSSLSAAMIPSELLRCWGITRDELDVLAASNMEKMLPPVLYDIEESISCGLSSEPENLLEKESLDPRNKMLILTNTHKSMGAASALYPGVLEKVSEMMGDDLTIIPSSTEEVIIVPKSCPMPPKEIGNMVREVNRHMSQEDILSDRVYEFTNNKSGLRQIPESLPPVKKPKDMER